MMSELRNRMKDIGEMQKTITALEEENRNLRIEIARPCMFHHLPLVNGWSHQIHRGVGMGSVKVIRCPLSKEARALLAKESQ
jgi:hypothetical protein